MNQREKIQTSQGFKTKVHLRGWMKSIGNSETVDKLIENNFAPGAVGKF